MRLIDADLFIKEKTALYCGKCERRMGMKNGKKKFVYEIGDVPCRACEVMDMLDDVENAPTVDIQTAVMELYKRYQPRLATNVYEFGVELQELLGRYGKETDNFDVIDNAPTVVAENATTEKCDDCFYKADFKERLDNGEQI